MPEGWIIVAAGNPPEYNKSVREFDVVTLDRIKKIISGTGFCTYGRSMLMPTDYPPGGHFLSEHQDPVISAQMETTVDGKRFATPRGWEDLSTTDTGYMKDSTRPSTGTWWSQYIQHPQIARDFASYLELFLQVPYRLSDRRGI